MLPDILQSSSGAASTLERLTKETDTQISQVHADVAAKKDNVRAEGNNRMLIAIYSLLCCWFVGYSLYEKLVNMQVTVLGLYQQWDCCLPRHPLLVCCPVLMCFTPAMQL